ncbi:MAG TPA: PD-(D/E)XK nuclease family protein, partial [Gemmatimonadaceae bacterium]
GSESAATPLDGRDVWLGSLADDDILLDGEALVRANFLSLDAGLCAREAAIMPRLTPFMGHVERAAGELDPRNPTSVAISPSSLEKLAACPLAWFYHYGLRLRPPEDPRYDPDSWLDFAQRGNLLHEVFEAFATQFPDRRVTLHDVSVDMAMTEIIDSTIARWAIEVPSPAMMVFQSEVAELRRSARSFLEMERSALLDGDDGAWQHVEFAFGFGDRPAGTYMLSDGASLSVRGRVDRVDALGADSFRVIDYKTGKIGRYARRRSMGKFNGGRQLQPAIYAGVLEGLLGGKVTRFEYRFPTERGRNATVAYTGAELDTARTLVTELLDHARDGDFIPTNDSNDCKYCGVGAICRVSADRFGKISSPRADWAKSHAENIEAYQKMLTRRTREVSS